MAGRVLVSYIWMAEHMRSDDVSKVTPIMFTFDTLVIFITAMYFWLISKDWRIIYGIPILIQCLVLCLMVFQDESPKFYYNQG